MKKIIAALAIAGGLAACSVPAVPNAVEAALINALTNTLAPGINDAIAKGIAASKADLDKVAFALPWAQKALEVFGPQYLDAATMAKIQTDVKMAEALLANPPTDVGSAVATALQVYMEVKAAVHL